MFDIVPAVVSAILGFIFFAVVFYSSKNKTKEVVENHLTGHKKCITKQEDKATGFTQATTNSDIDSPESAVSLSDVAESTNKDGDKDERISRDRTGSFFSEDFFRVSFHKLANQLELTDQDLLRLARMPIASDMPAVSARHAVCKEENKFLKEFYLNQLRSAFQNLAICTSVVDSESVSGVNGECDMNAGARPLQLVSLDSFLQWEEVRRVLEEGRLTEGQIEEEALLRVTAASRDGPGGGVRDGKVKTTCHTGNRDANVWLTFDDFCALVVRLETIDNHCGYGSDGHRNCARNDEEYLNDISVQSQFSMHALSSDASSADTHELEWCIPDGNELTSGGPNSSPHGLDQISDGVGSDCYENDGVGEEEYSGEDDGEGMKDLFPTEIIDTFQHLHTFGAPTPTTPDDRISNCSSSSTREPQIGLHCVLQWEQLQEAMRLGMISAADVRREFACIASAASVPPASAGRSSRDIGGISRNAGGCELTIDIERFFLLAIRLQRLIDAASPSSPGGDREQHPTATDEAVESVEGERFVPSVGCTDDANIADNEPAGSTVSGDAAVSTSKRRSISLSGKAPLPTAACAPTPVDKVSSEQAEVCGGGTNIGGAYGGIALIGSRTGSQKNDRRHRAWTLFG